MATVLKPVLFDWLCQLNQPAYYPVFIYLHNNAENIIYQYRNMADHEADILVRQKRSVRDLSRFATRVAQNPL